jgi:hypothetical protein
MLSSVFFLDKNRKTPPLHRRDEVFDSIHNTLFVRVNKQSMPNFKWTLPPRQDFVKIVWGLGGEMGKGYCWILRES